MPTATKPMTFVFQQAQAILRKNHPGVVVPSRREDDEGGGGGDPLEPHPILSSLPQGTSPNISFEAALEKMRDLPAHELSPALAARLGLGHGMRFNPKPSLQ